MSKSKSTVDCTNQSTENCTQSTENCTKESKNRTRNWTIVVYPDSAPENWRDILDDNHIEWVESPLHDKDVNPDGTPKKPHWHILLLFGGVKSYEQVVEFVKPLNCPIPIPCHNAKSLVRYMAHLDNPDKHQYDMSKIIAHGGIDVADLLKPSSSERYTYIHEMMDYCNQEGIDEFEDLMNYAAKEHMDDWFPLLCDSCAFVISLFLKSKRHNPKHQSKMVVQDGVLVDKESGEIVDSRHE